MFACEKYNDAERWVSSLLEQITQISRLHGEDKVTSGRADNSHLSLSYAPPPDVRLSEVEEWVKAAGWRVFDIQHGVRVYELEGDKKPIDPVYHFITTLLSPSPPRFIPPCLRVSIPLNNSPLDVFGVITSYPAECRTGVIRSFRVVESIDNSTDVVHLVLNPIFIYPTWTGMLVPYGMIYCLLFCSFFSFCWHMLAPRDLCLMRYWRQNADGSYVICMDSTVHADCPLLLGHIRAELHAAYILSPPRNSADLVDGEEDQTECMLTLIASMDPGGWIWRDFSYPHKLLQEV